MENSVIAATCSTNKKITVITGGSSGLGLATAYSLIGKTALLLCARGKERLEKAKSALAELGAEVYTYPLDCSDANAVQDLAEYAAGLGHIANVIHAAGVSPANHGPEDILRINMMGTINMIQSFYPVMENGVMVCISSMSGYSHESVPTLAQYRPQLDALYKEWNTPGYYEKILNFVESHLGVSSAYYASKYFVRQFVAANTLRFSQKGCRIISVSPGAYMTPMHQALLDNRPEIADSVRNTIPLKRWGHPFEMGSLIAFLCSEGAGYITGVDILADGGSTNSRAVWQLE